MTCPICHLEQRRDLVLDHDHMTGRARGYICRRCNGGLGYFGEDQVRLVVAARQLAKGLYVPGEGYFPTAAILSRAAAYLTAGADLGVYKSW